MKTKQTNPFDLAGRYKFTGSSVTRVTVDGVEFCFVPGEEYELPTSEYVYALYKQTLFELVPGKKKAESARTETLTNENLNP